MNHQVDIISKIKNTIKEIEPNAKVLLYGSYARGTQSNNSDVDILVLIDKDSISREDEINIKYPLYELEFEHGIIISPLVLTLNAWTEKHQITPFYANVVQEAIEL